MTHWNGLSGCGLHSLTPVCTRLAERRGRRRRADDGGDELLGGGHGQLLHLHASHEGRACGGAQGDWVHAREDNTTSCAHKHKDHEHCHGDSCLLLSHKRSYKM